MIKSDRYISKGGKKLCGEIGMYSAKNCVLALMAAAILCEDIVVIKKSPKISDVINMQRILEHLGCKIKWEDDTLIIDSRPLNGYEISDLHAKELRSSIIMLGSLLGRIGKAKTSTPGGCDIGLRPVDLHKEGLRQMRVDLIEENDCLVCSGERIGAAEIRLRVPSVGATENLILAAVLTKGKTSIINAAREPEIISLQSMLNKMGARVHGAGGGRIIIEGVDRLHGIEFTPIPDRIVTGTFVLAAAITGGEIRINGCTPCHIHALSDIADGVACDIRAESGSLIIKGYKEPKSIEMIETLPYPGFPTDLQAPIMALQSVSKGTSVIIENLFETRFKHAAELKKMGADISVDGKIAIIKGVGRLSGAKVKAHDLRGGAAMVLAGLKAEGETDISGVSHIDRGYLNLEDDLRSLGADIERIV